MSTTVSAPPPATDERVASIGIVRRLVLRPEIGSLIGAVVLFVVFASASSDFYALSGVSNWLDPASLFGIMAVAVALLMIGGHFDLSAGVTTGTAGLATAIMTTKWGLNIWLALLVSLAICLGIGFANGYLVTRTGLPSFIITLAMFLMLQGLNLAVTKLITGTVSVGGDGDRAVLRHGRADLRQPDHPLRGRLQDPDHLVGGDHRDRRVAAREDPLRQLDVRGRRRPRRQPQRRRSRQAHHHHALHDREWRRVARRARSS